MRKTERKCDDRIEKAMATNTVAMAHAAVGKLPARWQVATHSHHTATITPHATGRQDRFTVHVTWQWQGGTHAAGPRTVTLTHACRAGYQVTSSSVSRIRRCNAALCCNLRAKLRRGHNDGTMQCPRRRPLTRIQDRNISTCALHILGFPTFPPVVRTTISPTQATLTAPCTGTWCAV